MTSRPNKPSAFVTVRKPSPGISTITFRRNRPQLRDPSLFREISRMMSHGSPVPSLTNTYIMELPSGEKVMLKKVNQFTIQHAGDLIRKRFRYESPLAKFENTAGEKFEVFRYHPFPSALTVLKNSSTTGQHRMAIIRGIAFELGRMHAAGYSHGHPHLENFLAGPKRIQIVDTKGIRKSKKLSPRTKAEELHYFLLDAMMSTPGTPRLLTVERIRPYLAEYYRGAGSVDPRMEKVIRELFISESELR